MRASLLFCLLSVAASDKWRGRIDWDAIERGLEVGDDAELLATPDSLHIAELDRRRSAPPEAPVGVQQYGGCVAAQQTSRRPFSPRQIADANGSQTHVSALSVNLLSLCLPGVSVPHSRSADDWTHHTSAQAGPTMLFAVLHDTAASGAAWSAEEVALLAEEWREVRAALQ